MKTVNKLQNYTHIDIDGVVLKCITNHGWLRNWQAAATITYITPDTSWHRGYTSHSAPHTVQALRHCNAVSTELSKK